MICVKCDRDATVLRDLRVSIKVIDSKTELKKDNLPTGGRIWETKTTHETQRYPFGFCKHCIRVKLFFSREFFWVVIILLVAAGTIFLRFFSKKETLKQ